MVMMAVWNYRLKPSVNKSRRSIDSYSSRALKDGTRKVTKVSEVQGMEAIRSSCRIYSFQFAGIKMNSESVSQT
jgi:hypothetical protein